MPARSSGGTPMPNPIVEPYRVARLLKLRLRGILMRNSHRVYYSGLKFTPSLEHTMIADTIYLAEAEGKPFTEFGLAKALGMDRRTLGRKLNDRKRGLISNGIVVRNGRRLGINPAVLETPEALRNVRDNVRAILETAAALAHIEFP